MSSLSVTKSHKALIYIIIITNVVEIILTNGYSTKISFNPNTNPNKVKIKIIITWMNKCKSEYKNISL